MDASLAKTPLFDWHFAHGGRMVDFAGWSMPVQYTSIVDEHVATRQSATLFDVSHMGRIQVEGPGAGHWLEGLLTRRVEGMGRGRIRYSLITADDGGTLDDVLVYRMPLWVSNEAATSDDSVFSLVVNAGNRQTILDWLSREPLPADTRLSDLTSETAMIAVQGPRARGLVQRVLNLPQLASLKNYTGWFGSREGASLVCTRTGYTGEDGFELIVASEHADSLWRSLLAAGKDDAVCAAGLGARDTLRLEAGMPLYGHELSRQINPIQAGLDFAVDLEGRTFPGQVALAAAKREVWPQRVGLIVEGKRVAREGAEVYGPSGKHVGCVTSGTFSPTLRQSIAMAYVEAAAVDEHQENPLKPLHVDIRGRRAVAQLVALPFYKRP